MLNRAFFSLQSNWIPTLDRARQPRSERTARLRLLPLRDVGDPALDGRLQRRLDGRRCVVLLHRRLGRLDDGAIVSAVLRIAGASALVAVVSYGVWKPLDSALGRSLPAQFVSLGLALLAAGTAYCGGLSRAPGARVAVATLLAEPLLKRLSAHGPTAHPQLLDHRAHRPRQVDARRSHPPAHRHGVGARDARPAARLDGARARARDHDQGAGRPGALEGPRAEPDRHARPRRLHVRGVAVAAGVRGRAARRRLCAGDRGADARERLPRDRERPRDRPGREQDRPAAGRPRQRLGRGGRPDRRGRRPACCASRPRRGRG